MNEHCGMTRKEVSNFILSIINTVSNQYKNSEDIKDKLLWSIYEGVHTRIFMYVANLKEFDDEFREDIKKRIHLSSNVISSAREHDESFNVADDVLFGFYYGIIDTLYEYEDWGFMKEEKVHND